MRFLPGRHGARAFGADADKATLPGRQLLQCSLRYRLGHAPALRRV